MPSASQIREQVARETHRRTRLSVAAFGGGVLYLLSGIIIGQALRGAPTVGLVQGLSPALSGVANPAVSPRAQEVRFISHQSFPLIAGSVLAALAIGVLVLILLVLLDATRFRNPGGWSAARPLVIGGGIALAIVSVGHQLVSSIETHNFLVGHDFSNHAVDNTLTNGAANLIGEYLDLIAGVALAAGMVGTSVSALRVGLLPRWMGFVGMVTGVLIFLPLGGVLQEFVPAFWMVMMGLLYAGRWPNGEPPAWAAGEAIPWPSQASRRAGRLGTGAPALATAGADVAPVPEPATKSSSRRRRRKGGARG